MAVYSGGSTVKNETAYSDLWLCAQDWTLRYTASKCCTWGNWSLFSIFLYSMCIWLNVTNRTSALKWVYEHACVYLIILFWFWIGTLLGMPQSPCVWLQESVPCMKVPVEQGYLRLSVCYCARYQMWLLCSWVCVIMRPQGAEKSDTLTRREGGTLRGRGYVCDTLLSPGSKTRCILKECVCAVVFPEHLTTF